MQHRVLAEPAVMDSSQVMTPRKVLREAIINTVSPDPEVQAPSKTRRRVQHVTGEILTEETVLSRLREEEENRKEKRKKQGQGSKTVGNSSRPNTRKKTPSVDDMFLGTLSGLEPDTSEDIEEHGAIYRRGFDNR